jgi:hypothetical protein
MGVYIKGMEMPKNCFECPWRCKVDPENLLCRISGEYFEETFSGTIQNRHKSCPLIPVQPHGRLIDADAIRADIDEKRPGRSYEDAWALTVLDNAPTVIPADPCKEKGE